MWVAGSELRVRRWWEQAANLGWRERKATNNTKVLLEAARNLVQNGNVFGV